MRVVTFTQKVSPWNIGETAGFDDEKAAELVTRGVAEYPRVETVEAVIDNAPVDRMVRRGRPPLNR